LTITDPTRILLPNPGAVGGHPGVLRTPSGIGRPLKGGASRGDKPGIGEAALARLSEFYLVDIVADAIGLRCAIVAHHNLEIILSLTA